MHSEQQAVICSGSVNRLCVTTQMCCCAPQFVLHFLCNAGIILYKGFWAFIAQALKIHEILPTVHAIAEKEPLTDRTLTSGCQILESNCVKC